MIKTWRKNRMSCDGDGPCQDYLFVDLLLCLDVWSLSLCWLKCIVMAGKLWYWRIVCHFYLSSVTTDWGRLLLLNAYNLPLHLCRCIFMCMSRSKSRFPSHFRSIPTHICPFPWSHISRSRSRSRLFRSRTRSRSKNMATEMEEGFSRTFPSVFNLRFDPNKPAVFGQKNT